MAKVTSTFNRQRHVKRFADAGDRLAGELADETALEIRRRLNVPYPPASSPGESPHRRTGNLQRSAEVGAVRQPGKRTVNVLTPYGKYLEYGTVKMLPRPFVRPATDEVRARLRQILKRVSG